MFTRFCTSLFLTLVLILAAAPAASAAEPAPVKMWETQIVLPTYLAGEPEPNPMFFFGRQSQGAQGPVYPYPMYDTLTGRMVQSHDYVAMERLHELHSSGAWDLIGLGLGPLVVGLLSDALRPAHGADSLRLALLLVVPVYLWSAAHYLAASRSLAADLESR